MPVCAWLHYWPATRSPSAFSLRFNTRRSRRLMPAVLLWRIVAHRDASDTVAAEKQTRGIEFRHAAATAAYHADTPGVPQHCDHFIEECATHAIDYEVHFLRSDRCHHGFAQARVGGIE